MKLKSLLTYHINTTGSTARGVRTQPASCTYCPSSSFVMENGKPYKCVLCNTLRPEFQAKVGVWLW